MYAKYFFLAEEVLLGLVIIISLVMGIMLIWFTSYHLGMVLRNETTNENFKKDHFKHKLGREKKIINQLVKECEEY